MNIKSLPLFSLLLFIFLSTIIDAQVVLTSHNHSVYSFLERLDARSLIDFNGEVLPISRKKISEYLIRIDGLRASLNSMESQELDFYKMEFAPELSASMKGGYFEYNPWNRDSLLASERFWMIRYTDSLFTFRVKPLFGYGVNSVAGKFNYIRWPGATVWGYGSDWFGASFEYVDFGEIGSNTDQKKYFTPKTGAFVNNQTGNVFEYSDLKGSITVSWNWGYAAIIKDYQRWGSGQFGNIIVSDKAPSFTQFRFHVNPVNWFRFNYFQGWVNSLVYDSVNTLISHPESIRPQVIIPFMDKYVVANLATFTLGTSLDISMGNAFVYGPNFRTETLIPFMYYKALDHNTGRIAADDGNGMLFSDFKYRALNNLKFYGTLFVDVINFRDLLNGELNTQWIGLTLGAKKYNVLFENLDASFEYSRLNPWLYENRNDLASYKHLGYQLGHWIGQNADQIRLQFDYTPLRGLRMNTWVEFTRKAEEYDILRAYQLETNVAVSFMDGLKRTDKRIGFNAVYEYLHDLKFKFQIEYTDIKDEVPERTLLYELGQNINGGFLISYGL